MITQKQVREALQKSELSQAQLARKVKISPASLSNWFAGRQELSDATLERLRQALDLTDEESRSTSPEDAAAQEILNALGMGEAPEPEPEPELEPEPEPEPETAVKPEPEATPEPEPTQEFSGDSPAELIWELTRHAGFYLYKDQDERLCIAVPDSDLNLERFCDNLRALDGMLLANNIDARAHSVVVASLLRLYRQEEDQ